MLKNSFTNWVLTGVLLIILQSWSAQLYAQTTYTSAPGGGSWTTPSTWTPSTGFPGALDIAIINSNVSITTDVSVKNLTLNGTNNISITSLNTKLTVKELMTINGTGSVFSTVAGGELVLEGDLIVSAASTMNVSNLKVSQFPGKTATINGTVNAGVSGNTFSLTNIIISSTGIWKPVALVIVNAVSLTMYDGGIIDNVATITGGLNITSDLNVFTATAGAVATIGNCILTIGGQTNIYGTLNFSRFNSGSKVFSGKITNNFLGEFRNSVGENLTLNCDIVNNGLWAAPLANNGAYSVTSNGNNYFYSGSNIIGISQLNISGTSTVTNNGKLTVSNSTGAGLIVNNGAAQFVNGSAGVLQILSPGTGITVTAGSVNFSASSNEVDYASSGSQNVYATTYDQLSLSNAGTKTITSATTVNTRVKISSTVVLDVGTFTLNGAANLIMTETSQINFAKNTSVPELGGLSNSLGAGTTIRLYGSGGNQSMRSSSNLGYNHILINGTSAVSLTNVLNISGNLSVFTAAVTTDATSPLTVVGTTTVNSGSLVLNSDLSTGSFVILGGGFTYSGRNVSLTGSGVVWTTNGGTTTLNNTSSANFIGVLPQTIGGTVAPTFRNVTVNNPSHVTLGINVTILRVMTFISGNIITGSFKVTQSLSSTVTRTSGFVDGNLEKNIGTCAGCTITFDIGSGSTYAPLSLTNFTNTVVGSLTASTTGSNDPYVNASLIDPTKTVNRYWTLTNSGVTISGFQPQFTYASSDIAVTTNAGNFKLNWLDASVTPGTWQNALIAPQGTPNTTTFLLSGSQVNPVSGKSVHYQIGEPLATAPVSISNRLGGTLNWGDKTTWMESRSGTIDLAIGSTLVTGHNSKFNSGELNVGDVLVNYTNGNEIGTISSITDDLNLVLSAPASFTSNGLVYGRENVPSAISNVTIGAPLDLGANVQLDVVGASCYSLQLGALKPHSLTHVGANNSLDVSGFFRISHPKGSSQTTSWNINAATATCLGLVVGNHNATTVNDVAKVAVTTGTLSLSDLYMDTPAANGYEATSVLDNSGSGRINVSGSIAYVTSARGTLKSPASGTSIINYYGSSSQTIALMTANTTSAWVYSSIYCNNSSPTGVSLAAPGLNSTNFKGDLRVQSGKLTSTSSIAIGVGQAFQIAPGATLELTGAGGSLSGNGSYDLGTTFPFGNFIYSSASTLLQQPFGNLTFIGNPSYTLPLGATTVSGSLTLSNAAILYGNAGGSTVTVNRNLSVGSGSSINSNGTISALTVGGNWDNNGTVSNSATMVTFNGAGTSTTQIISGTGSDAFYNLIITPPTSAGTIQLNKSISVSNVLTLTEGSLSLNHNTLSLTNSSAALAISRANGYIHSEDQSVPYGSVKWTTSASLGTAYIFPFGTATDYVPFTFDITAVGAPFGGSISVATYGTAANAHNMPYPSGVTSLKANGVDNDANVVDRFWMITSSGYSTNPTASMTFKPAASEIGTINSLLAQRWSPASFWNPPNAMQANTPNTTNPVSVTIDGISNFGTWAVSGNGVALPVTLVNLRAETNGPEVELSWQTESEINNDHFEVERSQDGIHFEKMFSLKGQGNSRTKQNYSWLDKAPFFANSYYRLKQVDFDGNSSYSKLVKAFVVANDHEIDITPFPNPLTISSKVLLPKLSQDVISTIRFFNAAGVVLQATEITNYTDIYFQINRTDLPPGLVIVEITSGKQKWRSKFMVGDL
jgi:hypothetical protein